MLDELARYGTELPQMLSIWESDRIFNRIREYDPEEMEGFKKLFPEEEIILEPESTEPF